MPDNDEYKQLDAVDLDPNPEDGETPIDDMARRTGQGADQDTRDGAEPEAPGNKKDSVAGNPNQGTPAR